MLARIALAVFALVAAVPLFACSARTWDANDLVTNEPVCSANGRYCAVVRWHEGVPDFGSRRAGDALGLDVPEESRTSTDDPPRKSVTAAVYDVTQGRRRIGELPLDVAYAGTVLVSDDGRHLVAARPGRACGSPPAAEDPMLAVYRLDGSRAGALLARDLFTPDDLSRLSSANVEVELRHESDVREVVVIRVLDQRNAVERRVDLATATLLDAKTDIFPRPRVFAAPATEDDRPRTYAAAPADCASAFDDPALVRLDAVSFFRQAVLGPLPPYPAVARKARIGGAVRVEAVVSESGRVLCTRNTELPFGVGEAAAEAARRWRFSPLARDGRRVRFTGELLFHFRELDEQSWLARMRDAPPTE